jgi:hypothetical protein
LVQVVLGLRRLQTVVTEAHPQYLLLCRQVAVAAVALLVPPVPQAITADLVVVVLVIM